MPRTHQVWTKRPLRSKEEITALSSKLANSQDLTGLHLQFDIDHALLDTLNELAQHIHTMENVESLGLHLKVDDYGTFSKEDGLLDESSNSITTALNYPIRQKMNEIICNMVANKPHLKYLKIESNGIFNTRHLNALKDILASTPLETLILTITVEEHELFLLDKPISITHLTHLKLSNINQPFELLALLKKAKQLRKLHLQNIAVDKDSNDLIVRMLTHNQESLRSIKIHTVSNSESYKLLILNKLIGFNHITDLQLRFEGAQKNNCMDLWDTRQRNLLYQILKANQRLRSLDLSFSQGFTDEIAMILRPLHQHKSIKRLVLNSCNFSRDDLRNLLIFMQNNPQITHLEIGQLGNVPGYVEYNIQLVLRLITDPTIHLEVLSVRNGFSYIDQDEQALLKALDGNKTLTWVDISPLSDSVRLEIAERNEEFNRPAAKRIGSANLP